MSHAPRPLPPHQQRILQAVIATIRPRGHGFDQPLDDYVLHQVEGFLPFLPVTLRLGLPLGLELVEFGPPIFARRFTRFTRMAPAEAEAYLARWEEAGGLRGTLLLGLRTLVFLAFYQHPDVLAALGVDWAGRAETLVRRRAALLDDHAA
jgi:hypothetical protein